MTVEKESRPKFLRELVAEHQVAAAIWSVIIASLGFVGAQALDRYGGPQQVVVTNDKSFADTLVVVDGVFDRVLQRDSLAHQVQDLIGEVGRLRAAQASQAQPVVISDDGTARNLLTSNAPAANRKVFPGVVKGYTPRPFSTFASLNCPPSVRRGDLISVPFRLLHAGTVELASPVFVNIHRRQSDSSYVRLYEQQFELRHGWNRIDLVADYPPGKYELLIGMYLLSEVDQEFPPYYRKSCDLVIEGT